MSFTWNGFTFDSQTGTLTSAEFEGKTYGLNGCLWNVELLDCESKKLLSPMDPMVFCYVESAKTLQLQWESPAASVRVCITAQDDKTYWSISTASDSYAINKVVFPIIKGFESIRKSGREDYLLIPWQNGWVIQNPTEDLLKNTNNSDGRMAMNSVLSLCDNLNTYMHRIENTQNYDERMDQLETNIYITTGLIEEYMYSYLYYEAGEMASI